MFIVKLAFLQEDQLLLGQREEESNDIREDFIIELCFDDFDIGIETAIDKLFNVLILLELLSFLLLHLQRWRRILL